MRIPTTLVAGGLGLALLSGACNDDAEVGTGAPATDEVPSTTARPLPERPPDLTGAVTTVSPFEPVTEDCTPAEDLDPDGVVSSDDPPVCTPEDNDVVGTVLVEEVPDDPSQGRKVSFTVTTSTAFEAGTSFEDLAAGQAVDTWVAGDACAESYPEQCGLEAIRVKG